MNVLENRNKQMAASILSVWHQTGLASDQINNNNNNKSSGCAHQVPISMYSHSVDIGSMLLLTEQALLLPV
jgi:hypothetical protein